MDPHIQNRSGDIDVNVPRRGKLSERRLKSINVLAILAVMLFFTVFMIFGKRPTKSDAENRDLAKCPKFSLSGYFNGTYTSEFSAYFNDAVPMRSRFKAFIGDYRSHFGFAYGGAVLVGSSQTSKDTPPAATDAPTEPPVKETMESVSETVSVQETQPVTEAPTEPPTIDPMENAAEGEFANNILIVNHRGLMLYGGSYSVGQSYAETLNEYKARLGKDVNVYSMVAPTAVSYYMPRNFADMTASEIDNIEHINSFLQDVKPVPVYDALLQHKSEAIYSRTDHHWQPLGAYYAAQAFAQEAGVAFAELTPANYETVTLENYVGTLYGFSDSADLLNNPENFIYYKPKNTYTTEYYNNSMTSNWEGSLLINTENLAVSSYYLVFMGGDDQIAHVTTDCKNGRKLMILKDSYGNALAPCLTNSFSEIWVVDMRYFGKGAITFAQEQGITDVLFAMNTFSATGGNASSLRDIMY